MQKTHTIQIIVNLAETVVQIQKVKSYTNKDKNKKKLKKKKASRVPKLIECLTVY